MLKRGYVLVRLIYEMEDDGFLLRVVAPTLNHHAKLVLRSGLMCCLAGRSTTAKTSITRTAKCFSCRCSDLPDKMRLSTAPTPDQET